MCWLFYYYCSVLADYLRLITGDLQGVGLQGLDKEAPTSHRIPRINNEPSRPTEGVRFCLSRRSAPLCRENLFELNKDRSVRCLMLSCMTDVIVHLYEDRPTAKAMWGALQKKYGILSEIRLRALDLKVSKLKCANN